MRTPNRPSIGALIILLVGYFSAQTAFAAIHQLKLAAPITTENDQECNTQVTTIAEHFAQISGVSVIETFCEPDIIHNQVGIIRYAAPNQINIYDSNSDQFGHFNIGYSTSEACSEGLAIELPIYTRHTGLQPFAAYCYYTMTPGSGWKGTFKTAIYGINPSPGRPARRKHMTSSPIGLSPLDIPGVNASATAIASRAGIDIVSIGIGRGFSTWEISAAFYGVDNANLLTNEVGYFDPGVSCEENAANLNQTWAAQGLIEANFFCMDALHNVRRLGLLWWSSHSFTGEDFVINHLETDYPDAEACQLAKTKIVDNLTRAGENVLTALCSHTNVPTAGKALPYQVTVITK